MKECLGLLQCAHKCAVRRALPHPGVPTADVGLLSCFVAASASYNGARMHVLHLVYLYEGAD